MNITRDNYIDVFADKSGIHKKIVKKYFAELEKAGIDWQHFDIETIADEIRDFGQTGGHLEHPELRKRLGLPPVIEKHAEIEAEEQQIEGMLHDKPGIKSLLDRIYENKNLTRKQKDELKEKIIGGAPEIVTLLALYNDKTKDYAKQFLREMVLSPTADIRDFLKLNTLKIKSSRGWIKEINDVPLKKNIRSIDFVEKLKDYDLTASQPSKDFTIAIYSRKDVAIQPPVAKVIKPDVAEINPEQLKMGIKVEMEHTDNPEIAKKIAIDHLKELPDYYTRLVKMEAEGKKESNVEDFLTKYSYLELKKLGDKNNIRLKGSKINMLSELIRNNVL